MKANQLSQEEYEPYYADYIKKSGGMELVYGLSNSIENSMTFLKSIPQDKLDFRYDLGKWTIMDVVQHIIDAERVFAYRALCFAREDKTSLPGFDENSYAEVTNVRARLYIDIIEEYIAQRRSTIALFKSFDDTMLMRMGVANNAKMSVRAIGFVVLGHENHHFEVINKRYLTAK
ncbi:DinB family protein [Mangrovimonas aestuarii]|uniref:DinB family protein n=1 Tax=Mangrovimonas aestuarii TaxID=3018443 RepID=UPI002378757A|nr:DinB family protein [Mangrovimonas aestuarii]